MNARVLVPAVLLPHVAAPVPGPAALEPQDEVGQRYSSPMIALAALEVARA